MTLRKIDESMIDPNFRKPITGNGAPTIIPQYLGQEYFDLTNKKIYKAIDTKSASDFIILN